MSGDGWVDVVWDPYPDRSLEREPAPASGQEGPVRHWLGVDVSPDRETVAVVSASVASGVVVVRMAATVPVPSAVDFLFGRASKPGCLGVAVDKRYGSAALFDDLAATRRVSLLAPGAEQVAVAVGRFLDQLRGGQLKHADEEPLNTAIRMLRRRRSVAAIVRGDTDGPDVSSAVAAVWCAWALQLRSAFPEPDIF